MNKNNLFEFIERHSTPQFIYPLSMFVIFFILYTQSFNFRLGDQFFYANDIETGRAIKGAEQWHLFHRPLGWLIYKFFQVFGYTGRAVTILQFESAFFGAIGVSAFFCLVYNLVKDTRVALFSASMLAFSHSYWAYSGTGSAYIPSTFLMIFAFILLFKLQEFSEHRQKLLFVLAIALISALSALFWLPVVLCFPAIVIGIILIPQHLNYSKRFTLTFIYSLGLLLFLIIPLLLVVIFINECKSYGDLLIALKSTSQGSPIQVSVLNFLRVLYGVANAFVAIPDMGSTVRGWITGGFNLVRHGESALGMTGTNLILQTGKFLAVWTACLLSVSYLIMKWKTIKKDLKIALLILGVWILSFFCFGTVFDGAALERMLPALPAAILVIAVTISHINVSLQPLRLTKTIFIVIPVVLFTCNFSGFFVPKRNIANDKDWKIAKSLGQKMNPIDLVIIWGQDVGSVNKFLLYAHRDCIHLNLDVVLNGSTGWDERLNRAIKKCRDNGGRIFIHNRLILIKDVPESRWSEKEYPHPNRHELRAFFSQYRKIFSCIIEDEVFWEIVK